MKKSKSFLSDKKRTKKERHFFGAVLSLLTNPLALKRFVKMNKNFYFAVKGQQALAFLREEGGGEADG